MGEAGIWATCNVGSDKEGEPGWYFAWGETEPYNLDRTPVSGGEPRYCNMSTYKYYDTATQKLTKYCNDPAHGIVDNKLILDLEDDAAHVHMGGDWRMPTFDDFKKLRSLCGFGFENGLCCLNLVTDISKKLYFDEYAGILKNSNRIYYSGASYWMYLWSSSTNSYDNAEMAMIGCDDGDMDDFRVNSTGFYNIIDHPRGNMFNIRGFIPASKVKR